MGSRSRQILKLAMNKNSEHEPPIDKIHYEQYSKHTIQPCEVPNELANIIITELNKTSNTIDTNDHVIPGPSSFISHKRRVSARSTSSSCTSKSSSNSSSRSSSSSSSSSSTSSSSSGTSSGEDSDDSIKDPNFELIKEKRKRRFSPTEFSDVLASQMNTLDNNHQKDVMSSPVESNAIEVSEPSIITESSVEVMSNNILISQSETMEPEPQIAVERVEEVQEVETDPNNTSPTKKGKKRCRKENKWKKYIARELRNSGKQYQSLKTKKINPERTLKPSCNEKCIFKCPANITEEQRLQLLKDYWDLGHIEKQWSFIANSVEKVKPKSRYVRLDDEGIPAPKRENKLLFYNIKPVQL